MKETPGKCYGCGAVLAVLVAGELKPVTNSEWDGIRSMSPDPRDTKEPHCLRCGKSKQQAH